MAPGLRLLRSREPCACGTREPNGLSSAPPLERTTGLTWTPGLTGLLNTSRSRSSTRSATSPVGFPALVATAVAGVVDRIGHRARQLTSPAVAVLHLRPLSTR